MAGRSKTTKMVRVRLPIEVLEIIERRVESYPGEMTISAYISMRMEYDVKRKHIRRRDRGVV